MQDLKRISQKIKDIEEKMSSSDFWENKNKAEEILKEYQHLKKEEVEIKKLFGGPVVLTLYAGAGGDDAEDFTRMLYEMYITFIKNCGMSVHEIDYQKSDNGYRSITIEVSGKFSNKSVYEILSGESGVHRLVRLSPFNAKHTRETSFALVDVVPIIPKGTLDITEKDIEFNFSKSGGPGGQNVNKRETAVRVVHIPTGVAVACSSERSQELNRSKAMQLLESKLVLFMNQEHAHSLKDLSISGKIRNEWGSHIRSYVLHPYKQIKDLRTGFETHDVDSVLYHGMLMPFVEAYLLL